MHFLKPWQSSIQSTFINISHQNQKRNSMDNYILIYTSITKSHKAAQGVQGKGAVEEKSAHVNQGVQKKKSPNPNLQKQSSSIVQMQSSNGVQPWPGTLTNWRREPSLWKLSGPSRTTGHSWLQHHLPKSRSRAEIGHNSALYKKRKELDVNKQSLEGDTNSMYHKYLRGKQFKIWKPLTDKRKLR